MILDELLPGDLIYVCICLCGLQFSRKLYDLQNGGSALEGCDLENCASIANMLVLDDGFDSPIICGSCVKNIIVWNIRWRCPITGEIYQHCPTCTGEEGGIVLQRNTLFSQACNDLKVEKYTFSLAGSKSMIYQYVLDPLSKIVPGVDTNKYPHISTLSTYRENMSVADQCRLCASALQSIEEEKTKARRANARNNDRDLTRCESVYTLGMESPRLTFVTDNAIELERLVIELDSHKSKGFDMNSFINSFVKKSKEFESVPIMTILTEFPSQSQDYVKRNLSNIAGHHKIDKDKVLISHVLSYLGGRSWEARKKKHGGKQGAVDHQRMKMMEAIPGANDLLKLDYVNYEEDEIIALGSRNGYDIQQLVGLHTSLHDALCGLNNNNSLGFLLKATAAFATEALAPIRSSGMRPLKSVALGKVHDSDSYNMTITNKINTTLYLLVTPEGSVKAVRPIVHVLLKQMEKYKEQLSIE